MKARDMGGALGTGPGRRSSEIPIELPTEAAGLTDQRLAVGKQTEGDDLAGKTKSGLWLKDLDADL